MANHGASGSESKENLAQISQRNQKMTHNGLRSLNNLGMLKMRSRRNAVARQAMRKVQDTQNDKSSGKIVCGQGMTCVFVSAEVSPWSKTGGLGDVLGGLPAALAVSGKFFYTFHFFFFLD